MARVLFILVAMLAWFAPVSMAQAHEVRPAVADVSVSDSEVLVAITMSLEPVIAGMSLAGLADTNDSPLAGFHDELRALAPEDLRARFETALPAFLERITLRAGETPLIPELVDLSVPDVGDVELPRDSVLTLRAPLPADGTPVIAGWDASLGGLALRQVVGDDAYGVLLEGGGLSDPLPRIGVAQQTSMEIFTHYLIAGFDHIIPKGLDHILFVLGIFFFALGWRPLLWQVSAFTLAHTLTLALATLGIVNIPDDMMWLVEAIIALSIVFVAVENILGNGVINTRRVAVIFGFGLLHGLGFASVLGDFGLQQGSFVLSLIAFNIGVEVGQIAVLVLAFLAVGLWFGQKAWYKRLIAVPVSVAIAIVGIYWAFERVFL